MADEMNRPGADDEVGHLQSLFKAQVPGGAYDVTADGQHFLIGELVGRPVPPPTLILNWTAMVKR
jgi:hypothetical protein